MEMVSGKSIFRLMRENFFDPLGLQNTRLEEDLGFSCFSTAGDMARLGQLLLNKGSYGKYRYFSPETFEQLTPKALHQFYPDIKETEWGIGITWMRQKHPDAGKNGHPPELTLLSRNVIGHDDGIQVKRTFPQSATVAVGQVQIDQLFTGIEQTRADMTFFHLHVINIAIDVLLHSSMTAKRTRTRFAFGPILVLTFVRKLITQCQIDTLNLSG